MSKAIEVNRDFIETILHFENTSSKDETRLFLNSVCLKCDNEKNVVIESCSGVVLARRKIINDELFKELERQDSNVLICTEQFKKIKMFLNEWKNKVEFYFFIYSEHVSFSMSPTDVPYMSVPIKRIQRNYPETSAIIPTGDIVKEFIVDMDELFKIYKSFQKVTGMKINKMKFKLRADLKPIEINVPKHDDLLGIIMPWKE